MSNVTTKAVTLPDDLWLVLEHEAFLALVSVEKLMARAVQLLQFDAERSRRRAGERMLASQRVGPKPDATIITPHASQTRT